MYRNYQCNKWYNNNNHHCPCDNCNDKLEELCDNVSNVVEYHNDCECGFDDDNNVFPQNPIFGQSYVPWQTMGKTFTPEVGLKMGTIYPELVSPYVPCQSIEEINFIRESNQIGEGCNK